MDESSDSISSVFLPDSNINLLKHQMLLQLEVLSHQSHQHFLIHGKLTFLGVQITSPGTSHPTKMLILVTFPSSWFLYSFHFCLKIKGEAKISTFPIGQRFRAFTCLPLTLVHTNTALNSSYSPWQERQEVSENWLCLVVVYLSRMHTEGKDPSVPLLSNLAGSRTALNVFPAPAEVSGKGAR